MVDGGGPAGVKDAAEFGGGPAGVVDGFSAMSEKIDVPRKYCDFESGVAGGLEENGTWKVDMAGRRKHNHWGYIAFHNQENIYFKTQWRPTVVRTPPLHGYCPALVLCRLSCSQLIQRSINFVAWRV